MNCDTIDSILDDHRLPRLDSAERQDFAAHLAGCARCAGACAAHDALAREKLSGPPPELFARVLRRVNAAGGSSQGTRRRGWRIGAAAAAAAAVAIVALAVRDSAPVAGVGAGDPAAGVASAAPPPVQRFVAGRHYEVLAGAAPPATTADEVSVVEFFMFGCWPCFAFEPELVRWNAGAPSHVALTRVPAMFNPEAELHARAFYTAEALGKLEEMQAAFYDEIHARGNRLASRNTLAEFFARFGVDAATFDATFDSDEVDARLRGAAALSREYGVRATPSLVVAGRYSTSPSLAGPEVLAVVEQLVAAETACETRCDGARSPQMRQSVGE